MFATAILFKAPQHVVRSSRACASLPLLARLPSDPTYMIRAIPANASDNIYCTLLAHGAIHGAMAGFSGFIVGPVNNTTCYIPIQVGGRGVGHAVSSMISEFRPCHPSWRVPPPWMWSHTMC